MNKRKGEVEAFGVDGSIHTRPLKSFKLRASVYGVLVENDRVLVQRENEVGYSLPGGGIKIGERIDHALIREFKEETGLDIKPIKLLGVRDDLFTFRGKD